MPVRPLRRVRRAPKPTELFAEARGFAWIDGRLFVRVEVRTDLGAGASGDVSPEIVLVDAASGRRIAAPSTTRGRGAEVESWLDPRTADGGGWILEGRWSVDVRLGSGRGAPTTRVRSAGSPRAALIAGRPFVVGGDPDGYLALDASGSLRGLVAATRPRAGESPREPSDTAALLLDGVRAHGRGETMDAVTAAPEASSEQDAGAARATGTASVRAAGDDVALGVKVDAPPGRWRLSFGADASPLVLTVPASGPSALGLSDAAPSVAPVAPRVTVVACELGGASLDDALATVRAQSLPHDGYEVAIVGAERGIAEVVASTSSEYVLFIDGDDRLHREALERLVDVADATGADVVMGRVLAVNHRVKTPKAYEATVLAAEPQRERLLDAATPSQLFRTAHLRDHAVATPSSRPMSGSLLAAEAILSAGRVAALSDIVYVRRLGPGTTRVPGAPTASGEADDVPALADAIAERLPEGERRDALLAIEAERLARAVVRETSRPPAERAETVRRMRESVSAWWGDGVRRRLDERAALVVDALVLDDVDALAERLVSQGDAGPGLVARVTPAGIVYDLPSATEAAVPLARRRVSARVIEHMMTSLSVDDGTATVTGWIGAPSVLPAPDGVRVTLRLRGRKDVIELPATLDGPVVSEQPDRAVPLTFRIERSALPRGGRWDVEVAPLWGPHALPAAKFGSRRTTSVDDPSVDTASRAIGSPWTILYWNRGSLAVAHHRRLRAGRLKATGLGVDSDGRPEVIVAVRHPGDGFQVHAQVVPSGPREAQHRLPWRRVDDSHVAARLPVPRSGSLRCELSAVHHGIVTEVRIAASARPARSAAVEVRVDDGALVVDRRGEDDR